MKANLGDLNNILFEQVERLNEDDLTGEELDSQLKKSKAIGAIAETIVHNSSLILRAATLDLDNRLTDNKAPRKLLLGEE